MSKIDLLTRESVLRTAREVCEKYRIPFDPEGDVDRLGFSADLPKALEAIPKEYDVEDVISQIQQGQSLNIPHRGYCINKDNVIGIIRRGFNHTSDPVKEDPEKVSDDLDLSIQFMDNRSFCDECMGRDCKKCIRYNAKKNTLISLNFYRQIQEIFKRIAYLKTQASHDELKYYAEFEDMLNDAMTVAMNNTRML